MLSWSPESFLEGLPAPAAAVSTVSWAAALTFLNVFYVYEYHLRTSRYILERIESTFSQALVLCLLNSIPKVVLAASLYRAAPGAVFASTISGSTQISMAITLAAVLLFAKTNCFVHHISFYKDILFLEASHLLLLIMFSSASESLTVPLMALGVFAMFLFNTLSLPTYISQPPDRALEATSSPQEARSKTPILYPVRAVLNVIFLDPQLLHPETSKTTPYTTVLSPPVNLLIAMSYFRIAPGHFGLLLCFIGSFLVGLLLYVAVRRRILPGISCLYTLAASAVFFLMMTESLVGLTAYIGKATGLGIQFLSGTFLSLQSNIAEIVTCLEYSRAGMSAMASCSALYTHMYNSLLLFPAAKLLLGRGKGDTCPQNIANAPFVYFSYVFILAEIKVVFVNYLLRHHKLTKDLGYTLVAIYTLFIIGFAIEGKPHLCK